VAFYIPVHYLVEPAGVGPAFVLAIAATLAVQAVMLPRLRPSMVEDRPDLEPELV